MASTVATRRGHRRPFFEALTLVVLLVLAAFAPFAQGSESVVARDDDPQYDALRELFDTTGGVDGWFVRTGWDLLAIDRDYCRPWFGITCDESGKAVVGLALAANGLSGTVPASLALLGSLETLDLSSNRLYGTVPVALGGNLPAITTLNLSRNALWGPVPASFGGLTALATLDLSYNAMSGSLPALFSSLAALTWVDLSHNALTGAFPATFASFPALATLNLGYNNLSATVPASLGALQQLTSVAIEYNQLTGTVPDWLACGRVLSCNAAGNVAMACQTGCGGNLCALRSCVCAASCSSTADCVGGAPGCGVCLANGTCGGGDGRMPPPARLPPPPPSSSSPAPAPWGAKPPPPPPLAAHRKSPVSSGAAREVLVDLAIAAVSLVAVVFAVLATRRPRWLCGGDAAGGYAALGAMGEEVTYDALGDAHTGVVARGGSPDFSDDGTDLESSDGRAATAPAPEDPRTEQIRTAIRQHATEVNTRYNAENYFAPASRERRASRPSSRVTFGARPQVAAVGPDGSIVSLAQPSVNSVDGEPRPTTVQEVGDSGLDLVDDDVGAASE